MASLDDKVRGWDWVCRELTALLDSIRSERERLLGPDRGE